MFKANALYYTDGYKIGHKFMLAPNTSILYGTWIPRSFKHAPKGINKVVSFGQQYTARRVHDIWEESFFKVPIEDAVKFAIDMGKYLGLEHDGQHYIDLHKLGYLPYRIKALPEGIRTKNNIPHMTLVNTPTKDGKDYAWLTLFLETQISYTSWKSATSATIAYEYKKNATIWVQKTDPTRMFLIDYLCHDFSSRGLSEVDSITSGLGHITSHLGTDTLITIPASRYYYGVGNDEMPVSSVNASEHSVSTTKIFTVGEKQMLSDWLKIFSKGILSVVSDTFNIWDLITKYLVELKDEIISRDGKLVIRGDSGDPIKILCGEYYPLTKEVEDELDILNITSLSDALSKRIGYKGFVNSKGEYFNIILENNKYSIVEIDKNTLLPEDFGVVQLLWDIFGGNINELGYKVLDSHIGAIYGDSITLDRQVEIYRQLERLGFATTNVVVGIGLANGSVTWKQVA